MTTTQDTTYRPASASFIPQWAVDALGGKEATLKLCRETARELHSRGYRGKQLASMAHQAVMDEADAALDWVWHFERENWRVL